MKTDDRILELFKKNKDSFLSGEEVSRSLGISRQALWKHIGKLRDAGYTIEAVPHLGYKLLHIPDKILVSEIKWNLKTKFIGRDIRFYESLGSTNDVAYRLAEEGVPEGTIVIADEQTKGKGRLGRQWLSPPKTGIYVSCVLKPDIPPIAVSGITLVAAVSAVKAIRDFMGLDALIKWPNDILISDRKAGGILTELKAELDRVDFVVLGLGINVNTPKKALPKGATSLKEESKALGDFSRVEFVKTLLKFMEEEYMKFREKGFLKIKNESKTYSCTLGRNVSVTGTSGEKIDGKAVDIDENGALVLETEEGLRKTFLSGDVTLLR